MESKSSRTDCFIRRGRETPTDGDPLFMGFQALCVPECVVGVEGEVAESYLQDRMRTLFSLEHLPRIQGGGGPGSPGLRAAARRNVVKSPSDLSPRAHTLRRGHASAQLRGDCLQTRGELPGEAKFCWTSVSISPAPELGERNLCQLSHPACGICPSSLILLIQCSTHLSLVFVSATPQRKFLTIG